MVADFNSSAPIYQQLANRITRRIIRGNLRAGDKLPSVREAAIDFGVNPNTMQRTYSELERMNITITKRGQGTFVTENTEVLTLLREQMKRDHIHSFIQDMKALGFTEDEMLQGIRAELFEGEVKKDD